jgi:hypothetical protein
MNTVYTINTKAAKSFPNLMDQGSGGAAARTWMVIRALDQQDGAFGKGWIRVDKQVLRKALGVSPATLTRHLRDQKFFPCVKRSRKGIITISYTSLNKVTVALGVTELGPCCEMLIQDLGNRSRAMANGTETMVQFGQDQAVYRAERLRKTNKGFKGTVYEPDYVVSALSQKEEFLRANSGFTSEDRKPDLGLDFNSIQGNEFNIDPEELFAPSSKASFRFFRIGPNDAAPGISQAKVAKLQGRSSKTISRRLQNVNRVRWGLEPLDRRRVIQRFPEDQEDLIRYRLDDLKVKYAALEHEGKLIQVGLLKLRNDKARPFLMLTNVYGCNNVLVAARSTRKRLKRFLNEAEAKVQAELILKNSIEAEPALRSGEIESLADFKEKNSLYKVIDPKDRKASAQPPGLAGFLADLDSGEFLITP